MKISDTVSYWRLYFINSEKGAYPGNEIHDGPAGYCGAYLINQEDEKVCVFVPSTAQAWIVSSEAFELSKKYDPNIEYDPDDMVRRIKKSVADAKRLGMDHSVEAANLVLQAFGVDPIKSPVSAAPALQARELKEDKPKRPSREGLKSIKDAEQELGLKGRVIRGFLREAGVVKPEAGWVGDDKWYKSILKVVKEAQAKA